MPEIKRPLKVFLCHAHDDKLKTRELYRYLRKRGIQPWLDSEDLVGGQDWRVEIPKAIKASDAIIICLSKNSINKEGFVQAEITFALEKALEIPQGRIFIIPARFEDCEVPNNLERFHWVDLFEDDGFPKLMKSLKTRAGQLERAAVQVPQPDESSPTFTPTLEETGESEAIEKAQLEAKELEKRKVAEEKTEREAAEKTAREKAQLEVEELARQKAAKEKAEREVAEKVAREKAERKATRKAVIAKLLSNAVPFLRVIGILGIIIVLFWAGSWAIPKLISLIPTPKATIAQLPVGSGVTSTNSSATPTKTAPSNNTSSTQIPESAFTPFGGGQEEITDSKGVAMRLVPAGKFAMGSNNGDLDEKPVHTVILDSFYIDKYEVTNASYMACIEAGGCILLPAKNSSANRSSYYSDSLFDNYPVVYIRAWLAIVYCEWRDARLPTEAEWEKAARGTDERTYPWGEQIKSTYANFSGTDTTEVGSYEYGKSPYGAYDMAGNVWEWVSDGYLAGYYSTLGENFLNPLGPTSHSEVIRGGSWVNAEYELRTTNRDRVNAANSYYYIGFRCAKDATP